MILVGGPMAIYRLLREAAFGQSEIDRMTAAYELCLQQLRLVNNRDDPVTEILAKKIIDVARSEDGNPAQLCQKAIEELGIPSRD
jgi:hypothetical protein